MDKLQQAQNVIEHAGSEYSFADGIVRLRGTPVAYFRIQDGRAFAGSVGFCDIRPGYNAMSLNEVIGKLERIAYAPEGDSE